MPSVAPTLPDTSQPAGDRKAPHGAEWQIVAWLATSLLLRLLLIARGGAFFWTDEKRFTWAREAALSIADRDWAGAAKFLLSTSDHIAFRWLALPPAFAELLIFGGDPPHAKLCAAWFSLFSVANLALIYAIARRISGVASARWALAFAACSNALFYYARHCFPYDAALTFLLAAVYLGTTPPSYRRSLLVGVACGLGYLTYNGYWSVAAAVGAVHVVSRNGRWLTRGIHGVTALAGLVLPIALVFVAARLCGYDLMADSVRFAATVNQGDFGQGWRLMIAYLGRTDGLLAIGMAALATIGIGVAVHRREYASWLRWVGVVALLAGTWLLFSDIIPKFVLYGRTVRALVPFLALAAGGAVIELQRCVAPRTGRAISIAAAVCCAGGIAMMVEPWQQRFPAEFREMAERRMADVRRQDPTAQFRVVFADYLSSPPIVPRLAPHRELIRWRHPQQYLPYLFEGYSRAQRPLYADADAAMRLVEFTPAATPEVFRKLAANPQSRVAAEGPLFGRHHGPVEFVVRFPRGRVGRAQALLAAGMTGIGDQLFVAYVSETHIRIGIDHWGGAPTLSEPVTVAPEETHRIVASLGALFPPQDDARYATSPQVRFLERWLYVSVDGTPVLSRSFDFFPSLPEQVTFGCSTIGGSNCDAEFTGEIVGVRRIAPEQLGLAQESITWPPSLSPRPGAGFLGGLNLSVALPAAWPTGCEPVLVTGVYPHDDALYVRYSGSNRLRLGYRHGPERVQWSKPVKVTPASQHAIRLSLPALRSSSDAPGTEKTGPLQVTFDDRVLLAGAVRHFVRKPEEMFLACSPIYLRGRGVRFSGRLLAAEWMQSEP